MPMHQGFLPREGFCLDVVLKLFRRTAGNPVLLLPLVLLARFSKRGRDWAILHPKTARRLRMLFCFAVLRRLSAWYSDKMRNNWVHDQYVWSKEIVLVTGGAAGIGASMVRLFAEKGITVVVLDVQPMTMKTSSRVHHYQCDLRSPDAVIAVADRIRAEVGHPSVLIHNAGVARGKTIMDAEPADVRFTFDVNALCHYWVTKAFLPNMVSTNHGIIVTVSSIAAWTGLPDLVDYGASKAAALAFHEGLSGELKFRYNASRVRTITVHPGHTQTALFAGFNQGNSFVLPMLHPDSIAEAVVKQVLTGRSGTVVLPETGSMLSWLRALPDWYGIRVRSKAQGSMKNWSGRQVIQDVGAVHQRAESQHDEPSESTVLVS
ncbi:NAD(P)-binding domain protein [Metarhizium album ARSEF 1941]|uniref:Hydroxynaphthalene reductase-like protein Arp2 n=1 Tax=Metarhizium album (strain ARSEF 1941) TaxID=1081103 RepID=A0A0B2X3P6_METAS|nr:NAD(P)-binding domain protein [Metarhizium album ARSEF 1941]KHO00050.1 NAD(P)-binding domain protein [Metarhizium album ARSEF 1941]